MKKTLSLLKPYVHNELIPKRRSYLEVPDFLDLQNLKEDVKLGAVQFSELDKLVEKENEPKYIFISTSNIEQGYMAVSYLEAAFNKKHDQNKDGDFSFSNGNHNDWDEDDDEEDFSIDLNFDRNDDFWSEDNYRIPIVTITEMKKHMDYNFDTFSYENEYTLGKHDKKEDTPYWLEWQEKPICIMSGAESWGPFSSDEDELSCALSYFEQNEKVYLIIDDSESIYFEDELFEDCSPNRVVLNSLILRFSADEVTVKLEEEMQKKYYKLLFQGVLAQKQIYTKRGFSYNRLVDFIALMADQNKCQLVESVVNYAIKDKVISKNITITNADFAFIDRFCGTWLLGNRKNGKKKMKASEIMEKELVGMENVKKQVLDIVNVLKYNKIRSGMNIKGGNYHNVHLMLGAPGTAKTTVAKLMGQIMLEEQLLPDNRFICINGAELKGKYVGHSAPKTKKIFEENDIIVIDEAYSIVGEHGESDSFSKEAIAQLVIEIEEHSMDKLVILAGYGGEKLDERNNKMIEFLEANPGIRSRMTSTIYFASYSTDEMVEIFMKIVQNESYHVEDSVREIVAKHFATRIQEEDFGNGREARRLVETAVVFAASRVMKKNRNKYTRKDMQTLLYEDVEAAILQIEKSQKMHKYHVSKPSIGF